MRSSFNLPVKNKVSLLAALAALAFWCGSALAAEPSLINVNPQGTVTNNNVSITLDTEDLAKCHYSTSDISYGDMSGLFDTPDGLYHSASLGTLNDGSYTYYVRCKDFDNNVNDSSEKVEFRVGDISSGNTDGNNNTGTTSTPPVLSGLAPTDITYDNYNILTVTTDKEADCRYSSYNKAFDAMTLVFISSDRLSHTAVPSMPAYGNYTYYVRCRDIDGLVNTTPGIISFIYANPNPPVYTPPAVQADTAAPSISNLQPTGDVTEAAAKISCSTDEAATCKYDTADVEYDAMANAMDADGAKTGHSKEVTLAAAGPVTYYVRCTDSSGNKSSGSSQISFNYAPPKVDGPVISNLQPTGIIYQKDVALIAETDKPSDCRYATTDVDYDTMVDAFSTNDGQLHQATVSLGDYGEFTYYVRCSDKEGNKDDVSATIVFTYENPNPELGEISPDGQPTEPVPTEPVTCSEYKTGEKDGVCDPTVDCLCDADCPAEGENADTDCANVPPVNGGGGWIVVILIGLVILIVIILAIVIMKRRSGEEETVELP